MSVINKMLQELERRQQGGIQGDIGSIVRVSPSAGSSRPWLRIVIGALLLASGGAIGVLWIGNKTPKSISPSVAVANPAVTSAMAPPAPNAAPTTAQAAPQAAAPAAIPVANAAPAQAASAAAVVPGASAPAKHEPAALRAKPRVASTKPPAPQAKTNAENGAPSKTVSPRQEAEYRYQKALSLVQSGRIAEAQELLQEAVVSDPSHGPSRQLLASLLVDAKHDKEAAELLKSGLDKVPQQTAWAMMLARLQLSGGNLPEALATLHKSEGYAEDDANFQALYGALLQRNGQHPEAIERYQAALRKQPSLAPWWAGLGISLKAAGKQAEARSAFIRAKQLGTLNGELATFVDRQLKQMPRQDASSEEASQ